MSNEKIKTKKRPSIFSMLSTIFGTNDIDTKSEKEIENAVNKIIAKQDISRIKDLEKSVLVYKTKEKVKQAKQYAMNKENIKQANERAEEKSYERE